MFDNEKRLLWAELKIKNYELKMKTVFISFHS